LQRNKIRQRERRKKYYIKNPKKKYEQDLKYKFGMSFEQYEQMLVKQNYCCAICRKHFGEFSKRLCVDHCHITDKIRGLLCDSCNRGIGFLKFDHGPTILRNALVYYDNFKTNGKPGTS
jgi:hypothetical protein